MSTSIEHNNTKHNKYTDKLYKLYNKFKGGATYEEAEYYRDFMRVKADTTAILHSIPEVERECIKMCQDITYKLYSEMNGILQIIRDEIVPEMFPEIFQADDNDDDATKYEQLKQFIENEIDNEELAKEHFESFLRVQLQNSSNPDDIQKYAFLFYRFYLKGGTAFKFIFNSYKEHMNFNITKDEIDEFLGKNSDYDFDFLINKNLNKIHYDKIFSLASYKIPNDYFLKIIEKYQSIFNNEQLIRTLEKKLKANKPPLEIIYRSPQTMIKDNINQIAFANNPNINKIGIIRSGILDFTHPFYEKGVENLRFCLIRLMIQFTNKENLTDKSKIKGELIDVSVPMYQSYDRDTKWEQSSRIIKINNVFCYNLNSIAYDLKIVIEETEKTMNPTSLTKLPKRKKRLHFFNNLLCIIPRLIYGNDDITLLNKTGLNLSDYESKCEEIIDVICPNNMTTLTKQNLKDMLSGIYLNFPETINPDNLDIFVIIKQYFKNRLIDSINSFNEIPVEMLFESDKLKALKANAWNTNTHRGNLYYNIIQQGICSTINEQIYNVVCNYIIDPLKHKMNTDSMKRYLCKLFIVYSSFVNSFKNFFLSEDCLISFIIFLNITLDLISLPNSTIDFTYSSIENQIIHDRNTLNKILNRQEIMNDSFMKLCHYDIMKSALFIKNIYGEAKIYLRGSYAYNIHKLLRNPLSDVKFNDIDMAVHIDSASPEEFYKKTDVIYTYYRNLYSSYFQNIVTGEENISFDIRILKSSDQSYLIQISLNRYIPLDDNDDVNILFNQIPLQNKTNTYRTLSYHIFELIIFTGNDPKNIKYASENFSDINTIIADPYLNNSNTTQWFNKYLNDINTSASVVSEYNADFNNFYIQNIDGIVNDYQDILSGERDLLIKNRYAERLFNLSTLHIIPN